MPHRFTPLAALAALAPVAFASGPGSITVVFSNVAVSPTSDVPGLTGAKFASGGSFAVFDRPWFSPNGQHWGIRAQIAAAPGVDRVFLRDGVLLQQEGTPTPFTPGELWGEVSARGAVNDAGEVCLVTQTTGGAAIDDYLVKYSGTTASWSVVAKEGLPIPAFPGRTYGAILKGVNLLSDGRVAFTAQALDGGTPASSIQIALLDTQLLARAGVTVPAGQFGSPRAWRGFDHSGEDHSLWVSPDGAHVLIDSEVAPVPFLTGEVTAFDGNVVVQSDHPVPGTAYTSPVVSQGPDHAELDGAGNWYVTGDNVGGTRWALRNGVAIAESGVPMGALERTIQTCSADGAQVVPPSGSSASAAGKFMLDTAANTLTYDVVLSGVSGETAVYLAGFAAPGATGAVLFTLPLGSTKRGVVSYAEGDEANLLAGLAYLEVATAAFPAGELRGQITVVAERWASYFSAATGNTAGDWVVSSETNAPAQANRVVVENGNTLLLREGDPVDLDGNGVFDDDLYWDSFGTDELALLPDGTLYFTASLRNAAGSSVAAGVFRREGGTGATPICSNGTLGFDHASACPCGNTGAPHHGCANSASAAGALLGGSGSTQPDTLVLDATDMPASALSLFLQHDAAGDRVFHDGVLCAGGNLLRLRTRNASGGACLFPDTNFAQDATLTLSQRGFVTPGSGATRFYSTFYRNASSTFCPPATANVTNGVQVIW